MSVFLDETGFHKKTLAEIRREVEAFVVGTMGTDVDLSPTGPLGMLIATIAKWVADGFEGAQEYYTSRDVDQATGIQLDDLFKETGSYRLPATAARCDDVILWGPYGSTFTVPAGSKAKNSVQPASYSLESAVAFSGVTTGPYRSVRLELNTDTFADGVVLSVTLDSVTYTKAVGTGETEAQAIAALAASINAGAFSGTADYEDINGSPFLRISGDGFTLNAFSGAYFTGSQAGMAGIFVADATGTQAVPEYTLDTILTPVSGWLEVEQPAAGVDGTDVESDTAFRLRRLRGLSSGTATEDAIRNALYQVAGVSNVIVVSNRTHAVDSEGRPPNSVECVVTGGSTPNIARAIWDNLSAGAEPFGIAYPAPGYAVTGADGESHYVNWSTPDPLYAWVEVSIVAVDPDGGPVTGYEQAIKDAVAAYGNASFTMGNDFKLQRMYSPVYSVPGLADVDIRIAVTNTEGGSASYDVNNIPVSARQYLTFSQSRVEVLP